VEFALVLPLLLLTMTTTEFGRAIYQYNTIVKSLRATQLDTCRCRLEHQARRSQNLVVCGNIAGTGQRWFPALP
jgi:hypothetical protein